ncbi:hypothetical protein LDENG_00114230 [Lucifuga dentata]|nr:hypothetical protein LDENG_00114230 [Lucifuga dentata]
MGLKSLFVGQLLLGFVFVISGLIINLIQLVTCLLWPINKQLYRRINTRLSYSLWSQLVMLLEWWSGTECTVFVDQISMLEKLGKEHAIIILNHNYEIDFLCGWTIAERCSYFLEVVFCKRKWEEDRDTVTNRLNQLRDYPENVLLYCEGTRFTEKKHQISMEVADSKGLPRLKYHLLPRTKGFTTTLHCLRDTVSAVYDVTLNFRDKQVPTLLDVVKGHKYKADLRVRRFPVEEIPEDEKECADWLHRLYQEKDASQEQYFTTGRFPGNAVVLHRQPWSLLNFLFWAGLLLSPLLQFVFGVIASGNLLHILFLLLLLFVATASIKKLISVSEVKKTGSSYGDQESKKLS